MTTTLNGSRIVDGVDVPAVGTWTIDPIHSEVSFVARHLMVSKVRGRFQSFGGEVRIAEDPAGSTVDVEIDMASVSSGADDRDAHLRSAEFFDVERFPQATFRSTHVAWDGNRALVTGDLTILGVTGSVELDVEYLGVHLDPWGAQRAMFTASTEIDREDWGLSFNVALETGGVLVGKRIRIEIEAQAVLEG
jgi:polyisoprenoid-binding protein YceI